MSHINTYQTEINNINHFKYYYHWCIDNYKSNSLDINSEDYFDASVLLIDEIYVWFNCNGLNLKVSNNYSFGEIWKIFLRNSNNKKNEHIDNYGHKYNIKLMMKIDGIDISACIVDITNNIVIDKTDFKLVEIGTI